MHMETKFVRGWLSTLEAVDSPFSDYPVASR